MMSFQPSLFVKYAESTYLLSIHLFFIQNYVQPAVLQSLLLLLAAFARYSRAEA